MKRSYSCPVCLLDVNFLPEDILTTSPAGMSVGDGSEIKEYDWNALVK